MAEIGNKITDYPISSTISNTDKVFSNVGGALKQVTKETLLAEINSGLCELKMLGWNVPKECPIQNEVSGNTFVQKVGRVDLRLDWTQHATVKNVFYADKISDMKLFANQVKANWYCSNYNVVDGNHFDSSTGGVTAMLNNAKIYIKDASITDLATFKNAVQGVYLYYELVNPITMQIDGNEAVEKLNESLSDADVFDMKLDTLYYFRFNEDTTETAMFETYDGSTFKFTLLEVCDRNGHVIDSWRGAFSNTNKAKIKPTGAHGQGYYIRFTGGESQKLIARNITKPNTIGEYVSENRKEIAELKADLNTNADIKTEVSTDVVDIAICRKSVAGVMTYIEFSIVTTKNISGTTQLLKNLPIKSCSLNNLAFRLMNTTDGTFFDGYIDRYPAAQGDICLVTKESIPSGKTLRGIISCF